MLSLQNVSYAYDKKFQLNEITFQLQTGEILGVIGKSGCGKTTLLKLIFGNLDPDQGSLFWHEEKIYGPSQQLIAGKEVFKYVTQDFELMPYISVLENIIKPLSRQHINENIKKARQLLEVVDLEEFENAKVKKLSGGQKQRVALARALAKTPKLLLLDEPFSHIDYFFKNELRRKLCKFLKEENITCVLATHDKDDVLPFADKLLVLKEGKKLDFSTPKNLYKNPKDPYIASLFGDYNLIIAKKIWPNIKQDRFLIVYPYEIFIEKNENAEVEILEQYFLGQFYTIILSWKSQNLFVQSQDRIDKKHRYGISFDKSRLKKRLNLNF